MPSKESDREEGWSRSALIWRSFTEDKLAPFKGSKATHLILDIYPKRTILVIKAQYETFKAFSRWLLISCGPLKRKELIYYTLYQESPFP